jgi:hypothetical protein
MYWWLGLLLVIDNEFFGIASAEVVIGNKIRVKTVRGHCR